MESDINVLVVEDDGDKILAVRDLLTKSGIDSSRIVVATNINEAKSNLISRQFDLMILDINLPITSEDAKPSVRSGVNLLAHICSSFRYYRPHQIVFLSQFSAEIDGLRQEITGRSWSAIFYSLSGEWIKELEHKIEYIMSARAQAEKSVFDYDVLLVTALVDPELVAIEQIQVGWRKVENPRYRIISSEVVSESGKKVRVVAASAAQMGGVAAAVCVAELIMVLRPRLVVMCGITGGIKNNCRIGDILLADPCWDWAIGKHVQKGKKTVFQHAPNQIRASGDLVTAFRDTSRIKKIINRVMDEWKGEELGYAPKLIIGPVVSGPSVVASKAVVASIKKQHRKIFGIEMEAFGVYHASSMAHLNKPLFLSLKSVCDYADDKKDDEYQSIAAHISARFGFYAAVSYLDGA